MEEQKDLKYYEIKPRVIGEYVDEIKKIGLPNGNTPPKTYGMSIKQNFKKKGK